MLAALLAPLVVAPFVSQTLTMFVARISQTDLAVIADLIADGALIPVIDRREGLSAVPQAVRDVATRHVRGKVVVVV
jgi:NADPH:quinone reductase-like Zn-dependent oxidoreductase